MEGAPFSLDGGLMVRRGSVRLSLSECVDLIKGASHTILLPSLMCDAEGQHLESETADAVGKKQSTSSLIPRTKSSPKQRQKKRPLENFVTGETKGEFHESS